MINLLSPQGFLQVGGVVLVLLSILGFIGVIGPTPEQSLFGEFWFFTQPENVAHLVLGIVALGSAFALKNDEMKKWLVLLVGILGLAFGLINFFLPSAPPNFLGANLENPADTILHLVVGAWAVWAATNKPKEMVMTTPTMPTGI